MARRRVFGTTWWGGAWVEALEQRARLDPNRLPRGRTYARQERATEVECTPGRVTARVQGSRRSPYRVQVEIRTFQEAEWDRLLEAIAARAGHAAALLDGELDPAILDDAHTVGVELLPGAGELSPSCSCPDRADPCKHSAAVCYLVADELDTDPFVLLRLRGLDRDEVLGRLRLLRRGRQQAPTPTVRPEEGMRATEAWSRSLGELPVPPPPRARPGTPAAWPSDPPAGAPFTAEGLHLLASDAAERAWRMSRGETGTGLDDDFDTDLVRRAASALGTAAWPSVASAAEMDSRRLARQAIAFAHAGADGVKAAEEPGWRADPRAMAAARQALIHAGAPVSRVRTRLNTLTVGDVQIRLGADGNWWRFERRSGAWELAAPPASEPDDLWP